MSKITRYGIEFNYPTDEIYFDSATVGRLPVQSIEKVTEFYREYSGTNRGTHRFSIETSKLLEDCRRTISSIFKIEPEELSFLPYQDINQIRKLRVVLASIFN